MSYMYIFEDGDIRIGDEPLEEDLRAVDAGILTVIDLSTMEYVGIDNHREPVSTKMSIETFEDENGVEHKYHYPQ